MRRRVMSAARPSIPADDSFVNYRVTEALGPSTVGSLYAAHAVAGGAPCSLEVFPHSLGGDPAAAARVLRTMFAVARAAGPHVARVHGWDIEPSSGVPLSNSNRSRGSPSSRWSPVAMGSPSTR